MNKLDRIMYYVLVFWFIAIAVGSVGAYFYDWKWHNLLIAGLCAYMAYVAILDDNDNNDKK